MVSTISADVPEDGAHFFATPVGVLYKEPYGDDHRYPGIGDKALHRGGQLQGVHHLVNSCLRAWKHPRAGASAIRQKGRSVETNWIALVHWSEILGVMLLSISSRLFAFHGLRIVELYAARWRDERSFECSPLTATAEMH